MAQIGRPTKFTPDVRDRILSALRQGNYRNIAAEFGGVSYETMRHWLFQADEVDADPEKVQFALDVRTAEATAEMMRVKRITDAAKGANGEKPDWKADYAILTSGPSAARWGKKDKLEVTGSDGGPIQTTVDHRHQIDASSIDHLGMVLEARLARLQAAERLEQHELEANTDRLGQVIEARLASPAQTQVEEVAILVDGPTESFT